MQCDLRAREPNRGIAAPLGLLFLSVRLRHPPVTTESNQIRWKNNTRINGDYQDARKQQNAQLTFRLDRL